MRSFDDPGSIPYSAVIQPRPESLIQRGRSRSTEAVHKTRVLPISIRTEPGVASVNPHVIRTDLNSSVARSRVTVPPGIGECHRVVDAPGTAKATGRSKAASASLTDRAGSRYGGMW